MPESIRDQVLRLLMDNPNTSISGSELATKLHVTRSAVWKAVEGLRKDGFPIEAVTNRGYRLAGESGKISEGGIRAVLQSLSHSIKKENEFWIGWDIQVLDSAVSTNSLAKQEAQKGAEHGKVIIAREQLGGRGRSGRTFFSPRDTGLYLSVILRPEYSLEDSFRLTAWAALCVAKAIEHTAQAPEGTVQIKWINDLFLDGKKVCGILTEASMDLEMRKLEYAVIGVGLNLSTPAKDFPLELQDKAISLEDALGKKIPPNSLIAAILMEMEDSLAEIPEPGWMEDYQRRSFLTGKEIEILRDGEWRRCSVLDIGMDGKLEVLYPDGKREKLVSAEIRHFDNKY